MRKLISSLAVTISLLSIAAPAHAASDAQQFALGVHAAAACRAAKEGWDDSYTRVIATGVMVENGYDPDLIWDQWVLDNLDDAFAHLNDDCRFD